MLRTHSQNLSDFFHVVKDICAKYASSSGSWLQQTREHGDCGRLTCPIMPKESKYLTIIHREIYTIDSFLGTEFLDEASYEQAFIIDFLFL